MVLIFICRSKSLEYDGFTNNQEIEALFTKYEGRKSNANEFLEKVKDDYNGELFI